MAGRGPAPKDPSQRRRANAPARGEWVDLPPLKEPVLPELPVTGGAQWHPETVEMWTAWRADPVSAQWSEADVAYALQTIRLMDAGAPPNELRLRMDSLGLTPKGKRDLRWRLVSEAPAVEAPRPAGERALRAV
jgi:hypothetical protein